MKVKIHSTYILLYTLFGVLSTAAVHAQKVAVMASVDSTTLLIGDQTDIHLMVNAAPGLAIRYPQVTDKELGDLELIRIGQLDTLKTTPEFITQQNITIAAFDSGVYEIPALPFRYTQNGRTQTLYSQPIILMVSTMNVDSTFIAPIKPMMEEPITTAEILKTVGLILGILLVLGGLFYIIRKRLSQKEPEDQVVYVPPAHVTALEKLQALEKEKLWQQDKTKRYYTKLTFAFREYLENRYDVNALESTTDEILDWLKKENFSDSLTGKLRATLQASDLVKFAKSKPGLEVHQAAMDTAYEFIHATKKEIKEFSP